MASYRQKVEFSNKLNEFIKKYKEKGLTDDKILIKFFKDKKNLRDALISGYFSFRVETPEIKKIIEKYFKSSRNVKDILESVSEIRDVHLVLPWKIQKDKTVLIRALREAFENDDSPHYATEIKSPDHDSITFSLTDLFEYVLQDPEYSSDTEFVKEYKLILKCFDERYKQREQAKAEAEKQARREKRHIREKERKLKQEKLLQEEKEAQKLQEEKEAQQFKESQLLAIIKTLKDNPLNVGPIYNDPSLMEFAYDYIKTIDSADCAFFLRATQCYSFLEEFERGEIKLKDIPEEYFRYEQFSDAVVNMAKGKLQEYIEDITSDYTEKEELSESAIEKIKDQEQKILEIIAEKKMLANKSLDEDTVSAITAFEV